MNAENNADAAGFFGPPVFTYTRAQALADGFQVAIPSATSREAGITFPVFFTREVFELYVAVPENVSGQDEAGRLWDILWMFRFAARRGGAVLRFQLYVRNNERAARLVTLKAMCGPTDIDDAAPAITIMLPDQD